MRYALIVAGVVENVVLWDGVSVWEPINRLVVPCPDYVAIGWTYDGEFAAPVAP